jgi:hypothetical protein
VVHGLLVIIVCGQMRHALQLPRTCSNCYKNIVKEAAEHVLFWSEGALGVPEREQSWNGFRV